MQGTDHLSCQWARQAEGDADSLPFRQHRAMMPFSRPVLPDCLRIIVSYHSSVRSAAGLGITHCSWGHHWPIEGSTVLFKGLMKIASVITQLGITKYPLTFSPVLCLISVSVPLKMNLRGRIHRKKTLPPYMPQMIGRNPSIHFITTVSQHLQELEPGAMSQELNPPLLRHSHLVTVPIFASCFQMWVQNPRSRRFWMMAQVLENCHLCGSHITICGWLPSAWSIPNCNGHLIVNEKIFLLIGVFLKWNEN